MDDRAVNPQSLAEFIGAKPANLGERPGREEFLAGWEAACDAIADRITQGKFMDFDRSGEIVVKVRNVVYDVAARGRKVGGK